MFDLQSFVTQSAELCSNGTRECCRPNVGLRLPFVSSRMIIMWISMFQLKLKHKIKKKHFEVFLA